MTILSASPRRFVFRRPNSTIRKQTFQSQGGKCYYCGRETGYPSWTVDHKTPSCRGGTGVYNKVGACYDCNHAKGNMTVEEFIATDYLPDYRRLALGATGAPTVKYHVAKSKHAERLPEASHERQVYEVKRSLQLA